MIKKVRKVRSPRNLANTILLLQEMYSFRTGIKRERWKCTFIDGEPRWLVILFLPPNQTPFVQPLDCGSMGPLKSTYKSRRRRRVSHQLREEWRRGVPSVSVERTDVDLTWTTHRGA